MRLAAFPHGGRLFLDSNILLYHCWGYVPTCRRLIARIEMGLVHGITVTSVLTEVTHRLLASEAVARHPGITNPARFLRRHPAFVRDLSDAWNTIDRLTRLPLQVIALTPKLWHRGVQISRETGLLMNDALIVACLRRLRLRHLASNDRDFLRVHNLTVWRP